MFIFYKFNPLQDPLASIPDIILISLFCNLRTLYALVEFPPKIIPCVITKWMKAKYTVRKVTEFRTGNIFLITKQAALTLEVFSQYVVSNSCDYQNAVYVCMCECVCVCV
jgi:hypothetical protein